VFIKCVLVLLLYGLVLYVRVQELWSNRTWIDFLFLYSFWQDPTIDPYLQGSVNISLNSVWFHTVALCAVRILCWRCSPGGLCDDKIMTDTCTLTQGKLPNRFSIFAVTCKWIMDFSSPLDGLTLDLQILGRISYPENTFSSLSLFLPLSIYLTHTHTHTHTHHMWPQYESSDTDPIVIELEFTSSNVCFSMTAAYQRNIITGVK